jgi:serine/threonine protein kinase/formylglycine-generating enzyme required for sulfatase activity
VPRQRLSQPTIPYDAVTPVTPQRQVAPPPTEPRSDADRVGLDGYTDLGLLGVGGMGEVRRVLDRELNRAMAMKILRPELVPKRRAVRRFLEEAQATAQLQHPGIVPVHRIGELPDGRLYFTMREVQGKTFEAVIDALHCVSSANGWGEADGWSLRRAIDALHRTCEAVAYAHDRGVVHRDLKPENIMLGGHGEVLVVDWGLAKVVGAEDDTAGGTVVTDRTLSAWRTRYGLVAGTPAYMPPEQARGETDRIDRRSDVYALGSTLHHLLYGLAPFDDPDSARVLAFLRSDREAEVPVGGPPVPPELEAIRARAMRSDPLLRYPDAGALAAAVVEWLDGSKRRDQALAHVAQAQLRFDDARRLAMQALALDAAAESTLASLAPEVPAVDRVEAWKRQDEAESLADAADLATFEAEQLLRGALLHAPHLVEAHALLADHYRGVHSAAEAVRDRRAAHRAEVLLRSHAAAASPAQRAGHHAYLKGVGRLSLVTDPPGVVVTLHRYESRHRRLVSVPVRELGRTPLVDIKVPMGSYVLHLRSRTGTVVRFPVTMDRLGHVDGRDGAGRQHMLRMPRAGELGLDEVLIPGGWTVRGGDPEAVGGLPRARSWVSDFAIRRNPLTNQEYLAFLNALVDEGRLDEAMRWVPRERGVGQAGAVIYGQHRGGRFFLRPDADGDPWEPHHPVMMVDHHGASAFCAWLAANTRRGYRLPTSDEWGKAGRGADGRIFPWGDHFEPSWCCMRDSVGRSLDLGLERFPEDVSPYGIRHLAGLVRDWCADSVGGRFVNRGGNWTGNPRDCRLADRHMHEPIHRAAEIGFRVARSWPPG